MTLTAITSLESDTRKFFMNTTDMIAYIVRIKCFWGEEAKMSLTDISSLESERRKFFMNSTYMMCRKLETTRVYGSGGQNEL